MENVLIITPHSSGHVPQDVLAQMLGDARDDLAARERLLRHLFLQGDPYTDVIFDVPGSTQVHATVNRFVVDLNRRRDDPGSNGVVKRTDFQSVPLYPMGREPTAAEVEERLQRYWDPFHESISRTLQGRRIELLLDGHSMTGTGPPLGPDQGALRPAITLMTGGDANGEPVAGRMPSVPPALARELCALAATAFGPLLKQARNEVPPRVALNTPWSDDELSYLHGPAAGVPALGLEVNRELYLNEEKGTVRPERLRELRQAVTTFVRGALIAVRQHASGGER